MGEGQRATSTRTAGALAVLVTAALLPFGATQLEATTSFVPALISVVSCFDLLSVYLLVGGYRDRGELRQLVMALAYAWSLVTMTGYALAFPGAVGPEPPLASAPSTAPYLYLLWHCGFPVILGLAWTPWPRHFPLVTPSVQRARTAAVTVVVTVLAGLATVVAMVLAAPGLPTLIVGLDTSRMTRYTAPVVLPLVVLPLVVLALVACHGGTRGRPGPERWSTIVVLVCLCDLVLTYVSGHRFSLGWYCGRALTLVAAGVVLVALLASFRRLSARAEHHAAHDSLTGLVNRRSVYSTLEVMMDRARMTGRPLGVASLDLDHFKRINDQKGHETGDLVLAACGLVLTGSCRSSDVVARVGGEEFLILLPDTDEAGTMAVAGKMRSAISGIAIPSLEWPLTASLGVTMLDADDSGADLLRRADKALYAAKAGGRNRAMLVDVGA